MVRTMLKVVAHCHSLGVIHRCVCTAGALPCASQPCASHALSAQPLSWLHWGLNLCCTLCRPQICKWAFLMRLLAAPLLLAAQAHLSSVSASLGQGTPLP